MICVPNYVAMTLSYTLPNIFHKIKKIFKLLSYWAKHHKIGLHTNKINKLMIMNK